MFYNSLERFTPAFLAVFAPPPEALQPAIRPRLKREAETAAFFVNPLFAGRPAMGV